MRQQTRANGIDVPEFVGVLNYDRLRDFMLAVSPPWVLKPRGSAGRWASSSSTTPKSYGAGSTAWAMSNRSFLSGTIRGR